MGKRYGRRMAGILAALMLLSAVCIPVRAAETGAPQSRQTTQGKTAGTGSVLSVGASDRPALPLLSIVTQDGSEPVCEVLLPPEEGLAGKTITNNSYVQGTMRVSGEGVQGGSYAMKFKVRGNTSAAERQKKPYKIKLDEAADLFGRGEAHADKEWVLLNSGTNLKTWLGTEVSGFVGMEWTPAVRFVNVEINGDWRGLYILTESVRRSTARVDVGQNGYIFENDAYWWKEGDAWFKTAGQPKILGYTFKYPEVSGAGDAALVRLKSEVQSVEKRIAAGDARVWQQIDRDSWARWILARDILGQDDPAGSNIYFYKKNAASRIQMGPLWDFDSALKIRDGWSSQHEVEYLPYRKLFSMPDFSKSYAEAWVGMVGTLESTLRQAMDELQWTKGAALDKSRQLDRRRWGGNVLSLDQEIRENKDWLHTHLVWMNTQIGAMSGAQEETE